MPTKIEWANEVWNPVTGCTKISPGCKNCYAERMAKRLKGRFGYPADDPFRVTLHPDRLGDPYKWKKPRRIFICSMGDLFHEEINNPEPYIEFGEFYEGTYEHLEFVGEVLSTIADCSHHTFMVLTKRPQNIKLAIQYTKENGRYWPQTPKQIAPGFTFNRSDDYLPNLWIGVTAENQEMADERIPILLDIPAAVRFVSVEPMLGPVDLENYLGLDWVICGGESGPGARPMHPDWVRSLRDQCVEAGVPFFFKQWGEWSPKLPMVAEFNKMALFNYRDNLDEPMYLRDLEPDRQANWAEGGPDDTLLYKSGKKTAGRLLDGRIWDQMPEKGKN